MTTEKKEMLISARAWLNAEDSPSTGYVAYYHGRTFEGLDDIHLRIGDCTRTITIYSDDYGPFDTFVNNLWRIAEEVTKFRGSLDTKKNYSVRKFLKPGPKNGVTSFIECRHYTDEYGEECAYLKIGHRDRLIKLHAIEEDSLDNFKDKLDILVTYIQDFLNYLNW